MTDRYELHEITGYTILGTGWGTSYAVLDSWYCYREQAIGTEHHKRGGRYLWVRTTQSRAAAERTCDALNAAHRGWLAEGQR